jgi:hypothetical protein
MHGRAAMRCGALLREAHSSIAAQKIPERRLDQLGAVGGECCVANDPIRMEKLAQELQLAQSVGELNRRQAEDKRKKAVISEDLHREQVQKAEWHDGMGLDEIDKLTVPQLEGIAFVHFHLSCTNPLGTGLKEAKKAVFLKALADRRSALGSGAAGGGGGSRAEAPQGEQKPDVFSELGAGNDEAFGNAEPTRRMPSRGASRKKARASIDYGI